MNCKMNIQQKNPNKKGKEHLKNDAVKASIRSKIMLLKYTVAFPHDFCVEHVT